MPERGAVDVPYVVAAQAGDAGAFATLFDRWFDRVFDVAYRIVRSRDTSAEVAQDVFLVAWQQLGTIEQPASFGGWLLRTSRNKALNRLDRERRSVSLGTEETTMEIDRRTPLDGPDADPGDALGRAESGDLVWAAARALGERDASVLDLHLRHGLGAPEIAAELGVTTNNAHQLLFRLKHKLGGAIRSFVLWSGGRPACAELTAALRASGQSDFDADSARAIEKHAKGCPACGERQRLRLSPEALFAAVPIIAAGAVLKAKAAAALDGAGVPVSGQTPSPQSPAPPQPPTAGPPTAGPPTGAAPLEPGRRARRRTRRALAGLAGLAVVAIVVALLAEPAGHDGLPRVASVATDATTAAGRAGAGATTGRRPGDRSSTDTRGPSSTPATSPRSGGTTATPGSRPTATNVGPPVSPTTTATTVATTAPRPSTPPPTISAFRATPGQPGQCPTRAAAVALAWNQDGGTSATLQSSTPGVSFPQVDTAGQRATACVPPDANGQVHATFRLTVTGPGGSASRATSV